MYSGETCGSVLCRTWARLGLMSSGCLLCCCSSRPAQMMTSHTDVCFVIFYAIHRRKFHAFIHKKASTSGGRSPTTGTRSLTGALPLGPIGGLPRPHYFTPGRCLEGVTVVEPQKSTQKFLGLTVIFVIITRLLLML